MYYNLIVQDKSVASDKTKQPLKKLRDAKYAGKPSYIERSSRHWRGASCHSGNPYLGYHNNKKAAQEASNQE